jgi:hypothetical protein
MLIVGGFQNCNARIISSTESELLILSLVTINNVGGKQDPNWAFNSILKFTLAQKK